MGQKRDKDKPRTPLKRTRIARKPRTASKAGLDKAKEAEAFMSQFRGKPSIVSGRTCSQFLRDDNGNLLKTEAHHILPKSIYPEYATTKENIAVLTREEHSWAEDNPTLFMEWLGENEPDWFTVIQEHRHHRRD